MTDAFSLLAGMVVCLMGVEASEGPATPPDSPLTMEQVLASPIYTDLMKPKLAVGDPAYAFTLPQLDTRRGGMRKTGKSISLASYSGKKPVALIFGSYT